MQGVLLHINVEPFMPPSAWSGNCRSWGLPIVTTEQDYMNIEKKTMTSVAGNIDRFVQKRLPAAFKSHGTWCLFQCCFYVIFFFLIQWPTVSEWGQVSVGYLHFSSLFLREAPCSRVSVCDCTHVLPQSSGVADVSSPRRSTWLTNRELLAHLEMQSMWFSRSSIRLV